MTRASTRVMGVIFADMDEVELAYNLGQLEIHSNIQVLANTWYDDQGNRLPKPEERLLKTTVGRVIFNRILPPEIQFVNWKLDKGELKDLIAELYEVGGEDQTPDVPIASRILALPMPPAPVTASRSPISPYPPRKQKIINQSLQEVETGPA